MTNIKAADLRLFDGAGEGAGSASGEGSNASADAAQVGNVQVLYGKQPEAGQEEPAQSQDEGKGAAPTEEEQREAYRNFVNSAEYKKFYTEDTQRMINKRFKETKALEEKLSRQQAVIDAVAKRYNIDGKNTDDVLNAVEGDTRYYEDAALQAGMTVEQYAQMEKLKHDNERYAAAEAQRKEQERIDAQVNQWMGDAEGIKAKYPDFDLNAAIGENGGDNSFVRMLRAGVPMEHAYRVLNMDRLMADANKQTAVLTEKAVVDNVRAKGARPAENGIAQRSAFIVKDDVNKLTKEDRAVLAQKAIRGERIEF